jgi:L-galactose dehydrogenase/L-glyceraldehyde 3-phosphate reductase
MKFRTLGRTGLSVSQVGLGGAGLGHAWGETTDDDCIDTVRRAVELGVNFFDTSPMYGRGRSEENLGKGLTGQRHRVVIATKIRLQTEEDLADPESAARRSLEQSLKRLGTDYVDLLQVHHQVGPEGGQYLAAAADPPRYAYRLTSESALALGRGMARLVKDGKARFLGITAWDGHPGVVQPLLASGVFHTAQILYNLLNQTADTPPPPGFDDVDQGLSLRVARQHDIGVIGIRSHAAGALADTLDRPVKPGSDVARDFARSGSLAFLRKGPYATLSQVALRFCLDHPGIATVVPGAKKVDEIEEAVACLDLPPLEAGDRAELQQRLRRA